MMRRSAFPSLSECIVRGGDDSPSFLVVAVLRMISVSAISQYHSLFEFGRWFGSCLVHQRKEIFIHVLDTALVFSNSGCES